jgi:hypothetical protein
VSDGLSLNLGPDALAALAELVAEKLSVQGHKEWMTRAECAAYLSCPLSRLEKDRAIPSHKWDGLVYYNRREVDDHLKGLGR